MSNAAILLNVSLVGAAKLLDPAPVKVKVVVIPSMTVDAVLVPSVHVPLLVRVSRPFH